jgi:hypothetical protein
MPDCDTPTLYDDGVHVLKRLSDDHIDDYSLRVGPLYVEFSAVQHQDRVLLLLTDGGGQYVSVRYATEEHTIPDGLEEELRALIGGG